MEQPRFRLASGSPGSPSSLLLCGGGTGGHVYPALAVAAALRAPADPVASPMTAASASAPRSAAHGGSVALATPPVAASGRGPSTATGLWLRYVGSVGGMEEGIVARESDLPFRAIPAAALRGRSPLQLARGLGVMSRGVLAARRLIALERPAAILGTGGYVCVPLFVAARQLGVPTLIYLPDIVPGLAVKLLARIATRVACSFAASRRYLPAAKVVVTGYPVRSELLDLDPRACRASLGLSDDRPVLLVYGGSRGARSINQAVAALLPDLLAVAQVLHVCGREGDEGWLRAAAAQLPAPLQARYHLHPYLHGSMAQAFGAADLALCRAGASVLGELPAAGLPAVLVPYPYVHQDENADFLAAAGAAVTIADPAMLGPGRPQEGPLWSALRSLLTDAGARGQMATRARALAQPDAAQRIAGALLELGGGYAQ